MKELITISALSLLLAAGCASRQTGRGGAFDNSGILPEQTTGAVHPGTTPGTNPSDDAPPNSPPKSEDQDLQNNPRGGSQGPGTGSDSGSGSYYRPEHRGNPDEQSPGDSAEPRSDPSSPDSDEPDNPDSNIRPLDHSSGGNGLNGEGPGMFNLHRTILMIPI